MTSYTGRPFDPTTSRGNAVSGDLNRLLFIQASNNVNELSETRGLGGIGFQGASIGAGGGELAGCEREREDEREPELPTRTGDTNAAGSGRGCSDGAETTTAA